MEKLGFAEMRIEPRRKIKIVITDQGVQVRVAGYISRKPVANLSGPQINALRLLAMGHKPYGELPGFVKDICYRLALRGWATWQEDESGRFSVHATPAGREIVALLDY